MKMEECSVLEKFVLSLWKSHIEPQQFQELLYCFLLNEISELAKMLYRSVFIYLFGGFSPHNLQNN